MDCELGLRKYEVNGGVVFEHFPPLSLHNRINTAIVYSG